MHIGIAGEVRCVVTKADGVVKTDTGYQRNLILNQGLDFFGSRVYGSEINNYCAIGAGNSTPAVTQTKLDSFIAIAPGNNVRSDYSYVDKGDNLYRMWEQKQYRFTNFNDVNISEIGLVSTGNTAESYYLTTRVLIKDSLGNPTSISIRDGETLDIYYKIHRVVDITDKEYVINMLDGNGGSIPYKAVVRPANVGHWSFLSKNIGANASLDYIGVSEQDLSAVTGAPTLFEDGVAPPTLDSYNPTKYKRKVEFKIPLDKANAKPIRTIYFNGYDLSIFNFFQVRFGRVSDDAPIYKTANDTLAIPLEISWGRFEGEL